MEFIDIESLMFNLFYAGLGIFGFAANLILLSCLLWYTKFSKILTNNLLLICGTLTFSALLCIGYFFVGITRILESTITPFPFTQLQCVIMQQPIIVGCFSYDLMTLFISCDRLFAVYMPIHYRNYGETTR